MDDKYGDVDGIYEIGDILPDAAIAKYAIMLSLLHRIHIGYLKIENLDKG
ncbi:hypothetical protein [Agriterribacter sp.]|nr:hypothetical protein [Agriterribacter sp.]HRP56919.1 hypothetical protein [Agriterribacter sp.]